MERGFGHPGVMIVGLLRVRRREGASDAGAGRMAIERSSGRCCSMSTPT
jgi:hypothetical protein